MKLTNNGTKIVHVGTKALMPGESTTVSEKVAQTPAIKVLAKNGLITITEETETTTAKKSGNRKKKTTTETATATAETEAEVPTTATVAE